MARLNEAATGHTAVNGDNGPNLFSDAVVELDRLYEIERLARSVFGPIPMNDDAFSYLHPTTTSAASAERVENARKLGVAIGVFKESK
ncbi:MAG: hypothetical protein AXW12_00540 [Thalassospira sp. Nap_22]|nr:MAG: hypothetical protein AXW12_00540 [Thalassospira sp. Nap_22]